MSPSAGSFDLAQATDRAVATVLRLFRVRRATLYQLDRAANMLVCVSAAGDRDPHEWVGHRIPIGAGAAGYAFSAGHPLWFPDALAVPGLGLPDETLRRIERDGFRSVAAAPVTVEGEIVGALSVSDSLGRHFSDHDLEMLTAFAAQTATALENARLYAESERRREASQALAEVGRLLTETLDPDVVVQRIADNLRELLHALASVVHRVDPESGDVVAQAVSGDVGPAFGRSVVFPRHTGVVGLAIAERHAIATEDLFTDPRVTLTSEVRSRIEAAPYRAVVACPLIVAGRVVGALGVGDKVGRVFSDLDIQVVEAFANQAAVALENARLYEAQRVRATRLRTLVRLNQVVSSSLDLEDALREIARDAATLMDAPAASFWIADLTSQTLDLRAVSDETLSADYPVRRIRFGEGMTGWPAAHRSRLEVADVFADDRNIRPEWWRRHGLKSFLGVPVLLDGTLLAVLALIGRAPFRVGPDDWDLLESFVAQAAIVIRNARLFAREQAVRAEAEDVARALQTSEEQYRALVEGSIQGMYIHQDFITRFANQAMARILGYEGPHELVGRDYRELLAPHERPRIEAYYAARMRGEPVPSRYELEGVRKDGTLVCLELLVSMVTWSGAPAVLATFLDVTERKRLEEELRQAQKMEAVGRLAGGIAHDFNNLLTVIAGRALLLSARVKADERARRDIELIQRTAERAATLTQQLLAFSRKQVLQPKVLDLNGVVAGTVPMLERLIGEHIRRAWLSNGAAGRVRADPGQIEQVIMNLVVNARDAMPDGGRLTVEVANAELDEAFVRTHAGARAGSYVTLAVTDTGVGMDAATQAHVFEPFFTTKGLAKGTGLGLATTYGIVKQHGGYIDIESEVGRGTTFRIYLPRVEEAASASGSAAPSETPARASETILLVEDEDAVRELAKEILEAGGYAVIDSGDPVEALDIGRRSERHIDLLLTDVVMPSMNGRQLADRLTSGHPEIKVLYMSGYTDDAVGRYGVLDPDVSLIGKPFSPDALMRRVREALHPSLASRGARG